jgi:hypothetical protein
MRCSETLALRVGKWGRIQTFDVPFSLGRMTAMPFYFEEAQMSKLVKSEFEVAKMTTA